MPVNRSGSYPAADTRRVKVVDKLECAKLSSRGSTDAAESYHRIE